MDMWQQRGQALDPSWTKQWDGEEEGAENKGKKNRGELERERDSTLSLNFSEIGLAVSR